MFLALALFFSQLGTSVDDSQVHGSQNDPRLEGLVLENKGNKWYLHAVARIAPSKRKRGIPSRGTMSSGLGMKRLQTYSTVQTPSSTYIDSAPCQVNAYFNAFDFSLCGALKREKLLVA
jgi:hypothetical protein